MIILQQTSTSMANTIAMRAKLSLKNSAAITGNTMKMLRRSRAVSFTVPPTSSSILITTLQRRFGVQNRPMISDV